MDRWKVIRPLVIAGSADSVFTRIVPLIAMKVMMKMKVKMKRCHLNDVRSVRANILILTPKDSRRGIAKP
jgi:hypothetical protein